MRGGGAVLVVSAFTGDVSITVTGGSLEDISGTFSSSLILTICLIMFSLIILFASFLSGFPKLLPFSISLASTISGLTSSNTPELANSPGAVLL